MRDFSRNWQSWILKALAISAAGMVVGFGTCSIAIAKNGVGVAKFGMVLFVLSLATLLISGLTLIVMLIFRK